MMKRFVGLILLAATLSAWSGAAAAQGTLRQLGEVTPGHLGMFAGNGQVMNAGGPVTANGKPQNSTLPGTRPTGLGIVNSGQGNCQFSAYGAAYREFCTGFDASGNALLSLRSVGGLAATGVKFDINGTLYDFPGSGQGNIVGPNSSVVGNLGFYNNTTGTLLQDASNILTVTQDALTQGAKFEIRKNSSPLDYSTTRAAFVVQQKDTANAAAGIFPNIVFDMRSSGNGQVTAGSYLSQTVWMGLQASMTKSGDGSGHAFTGILNLDAVGAGGYNELCAFCATAYNRASVSGTIAGVELQVGDSADLGITKPGPTQLSGVNSRVQKYHASRTRLSTAYLASSEGSVAPDAILLVNPGYGSFVTGLDLQNATLTGGIGLYLPNNTNIAWKNAAGSASLAAMFVDGANTLQMAYGVSGGASPLITQFNGNVVLAHATQPVLKHSETAAALDKKNWFIDALSGQLRFYVGNDAGNSFKNWLTVDRTGATIAKVSLAPSGGDVLVGAGSALATNSQTGFLLMPAMAGAPSGAPTNWAAGAIPLVIDNSNHKICWNATGGGGGWKCAAGS